MPSVAWKNLRNFGSLPVKLPVKKNFGKCFIGSKEPPSNSRWGDGGSFLAVRSFYGLESRKTPSSLLKANVDATVKIDDRCGSKQTPKMV